MLLTVNAAEYFVLSFVGAVPFVVYTVVYPLFVGNVTVTFPFVHVFGVYVAPLAVGTVPVVAFTVPVVVFPALSFASTTIVYSTFCVNPLNVYVALVCAFVYVFPPSLLNLYSFIPLEPFVLVAVASVVVPSTFILFVVTVAFGVNAFGANLSIVVTFNFVSAPAFIPSHNLAYIVPFSVNVCVPVVCHSPLSFFVCNAKFFSVVDAVTVTSLFVQSFGVLLNVVFASVNPATVPIVVDATSLTFPA